MTSEFAKSTALLLIVLNPLALSVYLADILRHCTSSEFSKIMLRAALVSGAVFAIFSFYGPSLFSDVLQIHFGAFQVFGGLLFLLVALRFMLNGSRTLIELRGEPGRIAGAVAMPFMIGPGTVSAAAMTSLRQDRIAGVLSVACAMAVTLLVLLLIKFGFDRIQRRNAELVERYLELASRVSAMLVGSIAVDMIVNGLASLRVAVAQGG